MTLSVGIPKEIKPYENRVGLTPEGVRSLTAEGISVFVETNSGKASGFENDQYENAGASLTPSAKSLYQKADIIKKVKEPLESEYPLLEKRHLIFSFLHLASPHQCRLMQALLDSQATAIAYETLKVKDELPILAPMSRIAGALGACYAAYFQSGTFIRDGRIHYPADFWGCLNAIASHYPDPPHQFQLGRVILWGGGVVGQEAAENALRLGGSVFMVEPKEEARTRLRQNKNFQSKRMEVGEPSTLPPEKLDYADVLIGAAHRAGTRAVQVLSQTTLLKASRNKKKIIVDVSVDQGGNFPETRPMPYREPLYLDTCGNLRFSVPNIPSLCGKSASEALTKASVLYTKAMALDLMEAYQHYPELASAVNIRNRKIELLSIKEIHQK